MKIRIKDRIDEERFSFILDLIARVGAQGGALDAIGSWGRRAGGAGGGVSPSPGGVPRGGGGARMGARCAGRIIIIINNHHLLTPAGHARTSGPAV